MPSAAPNTDVMVARNERGYVHAISPSIDAAFDDRFLTTMTRQGCTVQVFSQDEFIAVFLPGDPGDVEEPADVDEPARGPNHAKVSVLPYAGTRALRIALLRMAALERHRVRHPLPWAGAPLTVEPVERLLDGWRYAARHLTAYLDARRGFAAALLLGRRLNGHAYKYAEGFIDARLRRGEITKAEAAAEHAALRGPEYFQVFGPWGGLIHVPNPDFVPDPEPAPAEGTPGGLPAIGEVFDHPLLGRSRGEYWIGTGETRQLVAVGRWGSGIVHPGQWRPVLEGAPAAAAPANSTKSQHHPPARAAPRPSMPTLFD